MYDNDAGRIVFVQNSAPMKVIVAYGNFNITMQPTSVVVLDKTHSILYDSSKVNSTGLCTKRKYILGKVKMDPFVAWSENIAETILKWQQQLPKIKPTIYLPYKSFSTSF